jgi:hypothetical protein
VGSDGSGCFEWGGAASNSRDIGVTIAAGNQPVVPDAMKALGQHMNEEAPDELIVHSEVSLIWFGIYMARMGYARWTIA